MTLTVERGHDRASWDAFVSAHPSGHFMQSHAWGELQRHLGWDPHYAVLARDGGIRAVALLLGRTVPGLGRKVFYAPRGPVAVPGDRETLDELFEGLGEFVRRERGIFLRCDPYWTQEDDRLRDSPPPRVIRAPRDWSSWNAPRFVFWLDLHGDEAALMKRMSSTCRNEVRRGYKNGVEFSLGTAADLEAFHRLMALTANQKGIAVHGVDYYRRLFEVAGASARVQLFTGRLAHEVIAAGVSVAYGAKAWLLYAASAPAHYKLRANRTVQWEMIKWAHGLGCLRYDFRGTATSDPPDPKDPGYGVYEFKKSFGPEFTRLAGYYDVVERPWLHRALRLAEDRVLPAVYRLRTLLQRS